MADFWSEYNRLKKKRDEEKEAATSTRGRVAATSSSSSAMESESNFWSAYEKEKARFEAEEKAWQETKAKREAEAKAREQQKADEKAKKKAEEDDIAPVKKGGGGGSFAEARDAASALKDPDFGKYAKQGAEIANPSFSDATKILGIGGWYPFGEDINNPVTFVKANSEDVRLAAANKTNIRGVNYLWSHMTDDEVSVYNYYLAKYGKDEAEKYLETIEDELSKREGTARAERVNGNKVAEVLIAGGAGIENSVQGLTTGVKNFVKGNEDKVVKTPTQYMDEELAKDNEGALKVAHDVAYGVGNMAPSIAVGLINPAAGAATMGVGVAGNTYNEKIEEGYDVNEARGVAVLTGVSEGLLQYAMGGIGKLGGKAGGKVLSKILPKGADKVAEVVAKVSAGSPRIVQAIGHAAVEMGKEGTEEAIQTYLEPLFDSWVTDKAYEAPDFEDVVYNALIGALTSGVLEGAPSVVGSTVDTIAHPDVNADGYTKDEQSVIDKVVEDRVAEKEKDGEKLTFSEKQEIKKKVQEDLDKGYLDADSLDEMFGGDEYKAYTEAVEKEDDLRQEYEELGKVTTPTLAQKTRWDELNAIKDSFTKDDNRNALRARAQEATWNRLKDSRLAETLRERNRANLQFADDPSTYENENARKTVENILGSGMMNNTNRAHEMASNLVKFAEDRNVTFELTDNKKLKEEGKVYTFKKDITADGNSAVFSLGMKNIDSDFQPVVTVNGEAVGNYKIDYETGKITFDSPVAADSVVHVEYQKVSAMNGSYNPDNRVITINMDSDEAWQVTVGHEVTHSLEGLGDLYKKYSSVLREYAEKKGEYNMIRDAVSGTYNKSEDINREVTAILTSEYLFTDEEFARNLSANHRNLFQKIYDEIKHLYKLVTAGSQEARELEKVKHTFEKLYREQADAKAESGAQMRYAVYLSQEDIPGYLKAGNRQNKNRQARYDEGQQIIVSSDEEFDSFIKKSIEGNQGAMVAYGKVDDDLARQVGEKSDSKIDISNAYLELLSDDIHHAYREHEKAKEPGDMDMSIDEFIYALKNVNRGEVLNANQFKDGRQRVELAIPAEDGTMLIVEIASKSAGTFRFKTGWKVTSEKFAQKKRSSMPAAGSISSTNTARDNTASEVIIPQNSEKSSGNAENVAPINEQNSLSIDSELDGQKIDPVRFSQNESDTQYSISYSEDIAKGQKKWISANAAKSHVTDEELAEAHKVTAAMVDVMMQYSSILPEDKIGKVLTKNGSYDRSVENTTICIRTLAYNEFVDKVQEQIGRPLTQMESFLVSQKLYDIATDPQCLYCYVSLDRKSFNEMLLRYMQDRDTVIDKYNKSDKMPATVDALYQEFLNGRKDTDNMKDRFNKWIGYADSGTQLLSLADIATNDRQSAINADGGILAEQLKDARAYAQSASWSKIQKDYVAYRDEILKLGDRVVKNLNEHYGMRWYSFSDYSPAFIVENMQQITDAAIRGLKGLSYTKDTDFAEIFAPSGMNINISVFVNRDADGNFFIDDRQSADFQRAIELREQYPNVGIVATVTDDEALRWAGEQEWSDVIIPFHIVRTGTDVAEYYKWLNYTAESADTISDKSLWDAYVDSLNPKTEAARRKVSKNIYPSEHKNSKEVYLNLCQSRGLTPRFARFAGEAWYMKLVNETRLSADQSTPLKPIFNEDAAKASFAKFVEKGGYEGGWYKDGVDVDAEAGIVAGDVLAGKKANEVSYGRQDNFDPNVIMAKRKSIRGHQHSIDTSIAPIRGGDWRTPVRDLRYSETEDIAAVAGERLHSVDTTSAQMPSQTAPMNVQTPPSGDPIAPPPQKSEPKRVKPTTAEILTEEPKAKNRKRGLWSLAKEYVLDNGMVFEEVAKENNNRELEARWNSIRNAPKKAQHFIEHGKDGTRSVNAIRKEVEKRGLVKQLSEYVYHMHNIDRMSLESKAKAEADQLLRENPMLAEITVHHKVKDIIAKIEAKTTQMSADEAVDTDLASKNAEMLKNKNSVAEDLHEKAQRYAHLMSVKNKPVFGDEITADVSYVKVQELLKQNPELKQYAEEIYQNNRYLRNMMVEEGVISYETAKLWEEMYPHYVPVRREGDVGLNVNVPLDTRRTGINAPVKGATGGSRNILPLFDTLGIRAIQTYNAIAKNRFGIELMDTMGSTVESDTATLDDAIGALDQSDKLLKPGENGMRPTFTVFDGGERVTFEITDEMYDAMKPTGDVLSYTNKVANTASNLFRGLLTEYNPVFIAKNAIKDVQDVLINSQHPLKTYAAIPRAIWQMADKGKYFREYVENGGENNTYFERETSTFAKDNKAKEVAKTILGLNLVSKANNIVEMAPRLAEYIASREAGRSIDVSMLDAARVTTNFAAGGKLTKFLNRNGATFLSASVNGAVQQARNLVEAKQNGVKGVIGLAAKFIAAGLPMVLLNDLIWDDDDEYEELSDYVKQNYYIVGKFGDGKFVRIPKGRTVAVIQDAFLQMENLITGNDEADLGAFLELAVSNLAPNNPIDDNIIAPIKQVMENKTWYGEDLVPQRLQDLPPGEQYDESTDEISRWLGEKLDFISPYKVNYLLNQYTGGVGDVVLPMLTPEAESGDDSILGSLLAPIRSTFTTDSVMNNQNVSDFYDKKDELTTNAKGKAATDEDVLMSKFMNSMNAEISALYAQKREVQSSDLPDGVKYQQVRKIQDQIVDLTRKSLSTYEDIKYDGDYAVIGDRYFKKDGDGEWQKLSDDQVTKHKITSAAGDEHYATDGVNHYRLYVKEGETEGEWRKITDKELEKQKEVTSALGITAKEYWKKKDEYTFAYESPAKYEVSRVVGGYDAYKEYQSEMYDIKADKDAEGKSISGSRKEKVIDYINSLDADYGEKLVLFKSEYPADDTYNNEIIDYLNGREDLTYEQMVTILKELGFKVSGNNITW